MENPDRHKIHRVALLVPSSNTIMENDFHQSLPKSRYSVHTDRMYLVEATREAEFAMIEQYAPQAAADLGTLAPDLLVFGCTSAGSLFGRAYDAKVCASLGETAGCPALGVVSSAAEALRRRSITRLAVITPYVEELTQAVAAALSDADREVVTAAGMGISVNVALADPTPEEICAFAKDRLAGHSFEAVFLSCTNFRALEARAALEKDLGVPVITSNSATLEAVRRHFEG